MHMTLVAGGRGKGENLLQRGTIYSKVDYPQAPPISVVNLLCDSVTFCPVFRLPHISLLPPLHVLSTNSVAERTKTGMSVYVGSVIGASLSKPHTSVTAFAEVVCMSVCLSVCLFVAIYRKF